MKEVKSKEYHDYAKQVIRNSKALAEYLVEQGATLISGGTDNHLLLWDVKPMGINGAQLEKVCEYAEISLNKNTVIGDKSAVIPGGVRIGTPAVTSRGMKEEDIREVGKFLMRAARISQKYKEMKIKPFEEKIKNDPEVEVLKNDVIRFAMSFPVPGLDTEKLKY